MLLTAWTAGFPPDTCAVTQALLSLLIALMLQPMVGAFAILSVCPNL